MVKHDRHLRTLILVNSLGLRNVDEDCGRFSFSVALLLSNSAACGQEEVEKMYRSDQHSCCLNSTTLYILKSLKHRPVLGSG